MLKSIGADNILKEFMGARGDNMESKMAMYNEIANYGYTYLDHLPKGTHGVGVETAWVYLISAGVDNDLM